MQNLRLFGMNFKNLMKFFLKTVLKLVDLYYLKFIFGIKKN